MNCTNKMNIQKPLRTTKVHEPNHHLLAENDLEEAHHQMNPEIMFIESRANFRKHIEIEIKVKTRW